MHAITCLTPIKVADRSVVAAWQYLEQQGQLSVRYVEFRLLNQLSWILRGREHSPVARIFRNLAGLVRLWLGKNEGLVLGTEPFRFMTYAIQRFKRRHRCLYWTTWDWAGERWARLPLLPGRERIWRHFLQDLVCVASIKTAAPALAAYGARAYYIPHPVDADFFSPAAAPRTADRCVVLFVGELARYKGVHLLAQAIRGRNWPDVEFHFVGRGPLAGELQQLERAGQPVRYLGQIKDRRQVLDLYRAADLLVLPSIKIGRQEEKFGMVLTEAMACGLPVIASDCIGPRHVVDHGVNGLLIPQNDVAALGDAIARLAADAGRRADLGCAGRKKALEEYDVKVVARQWLEVLDTLAVTP